MLPIMGQQRQMSLEATFDKQKKCLTFTLKNNDKKLKAILRHSQTNDGSDTGSFYDLNIYDKYLQPIITQYFIDNKSEIWLLFLIAHSKR